MIINKEVGEIMVYEQILFKENLEDIVSVNVTDIDFISFKKNRIIWHLGQEVLYSLVNLKDIQKLGFQSYSSKILINLAQMKSFDSKKNIILFNSGSQFPISYRDTTSFEILLNNHTYLPIRGKVTVLDDCREICSIELNEVDFIHLHGKVPVYNIGEKQYKQITQLVDLEDSKMLSNLGFEYTDSINYVQLKKVTLMDRKCGYLYFDQQVSPKSKRASIARVQHILRDILENKTINQVIN
ncbi:LytTR family transcriptional regulator DNA-binding domain-containing protein [Paenibacillus agricola]|uniref:HTH LytTR-type domain-containing protein n=1 Tax=Paenibacillus agricola TaxID=2716264 RepID=A0ABX0JBX6_9BACL|nr:LytTR family transcriptional regulator DNA-binding domain-containing protein [Paenibacillus agricola]NHN32875.1 hypothetical protein [Paenibacillus agricola]